MEGLFLLHFRAHSSWCSQVWGAQEELSHLSVSGQLENGFSTRKQFRGELANQTDASL